MPPSAPQPSDAYVPRRPSESLFLDVRSLRCHCRVWGDPSHPPIVLLHGGRDASITFQFMVDALGGGWRLIAPDWRGHGLSGRAPQGYWFQDYLADLDALLDRLAPDRPVRIVGHSLGGNVACVYAGVRPERVSHLASLDGFGLPDRAAETAPEHLRRWLDALRAPEPTGRRYATLEDMARRLAAAHPRLGFGRALFLAEHLSVPAEGGRQWAYDPRHRLPFATLHRFAEWAACVRRITAPVLWVGSGQVFPPALASEPDGFAARLALLPQGSFVRIEGAGHNLHHDEPEKVAALVEAFLGPADDASPREAVPAAAP